MGSVEALIVPYLNSSILPPRRRACGMMQLRDNVIWGEILQAQFRSAPESGVQGFNNLAGDRRKNIPGNVILRPLSRYEAYETIASLAPRSNRTSKLCSGCLRADGQRRFAGVGRQRPLKYRLFSMPQSGGIAR